MRFSFASRPRRQHSARVEEADILSDYAWKLRYPGAPYTPGNIKMPANHTDLEKTLWSAAGLRRR
jgi:hypothetical protein